MAYATDALNVIYVSGSFVRSSRYLAPDIIGEFSERSSSKRSIIAMHELLTAIWTCERKKTSLIAA